VPEEAGRGPPAEPRLEPDLADGLEVTEATAPLLELEESEPEPDLVSEEVLEALVLVDLALLLNFVAVAGRVPLSLRDTSSSQRGTRTGQVVTPRAKAKTAIWIMEVFILIV